MKTLVNPFLCKRILFLTSILLCINIYAEDTLSDIEDLENDIWEVEEISEYDPFEKINRPIYRLNDFIYLRVFDPITNIYVRYTPETIRKSFKNFSTNLNYPIRFISNIAQLKGKEAYYETLKFCINSTVGFLGLNEPSEKYDHLKDIPSEDFGQALAFWGIPEGPYLVIPLLGPSTLRDFPAMIAEKELNPLDMRSDDWDDKGWELRATLSAIEILVRTEEILPRYKGMKKASIDSYSLVRSAYLQQRLQEIAH